MSQKNKLFLDSASLSILHGCNLAIPLILTPIVVRIIGIEKFGLIAFSSAIVGYAGVIVDYAFTQTATKLVVGHRNNTSKLSEIFIAVGFIKIIAAFLCLALILASIILLGIYNEIPLYLLTYGFVFGQVLLPNWLFMGMGEMKELAVVSSLPRIVCSIIMVFALELTGNYLTVPLWNSIGFLISGVIGCIFCIKKYKLKACIPARKEVYLQLREGYDVFASRIYSTLGTSSNTVILGIFSTATQVGYYSLAYKVVISLAGIFDAINQSFYPYLVKLFQSDLPKYLKTKEQLIIAFLIGSVATSFFFIAVRDFISNILLGSSSYDLSVVMLVLFFSLSVWPVNSLYTTIYLSSNREKVIKRIVLSSSLLCLVFSIPLSITNGAIGLSFAIIISQLAMFITFARLDKKISSLAILSSNANDTK